MSTLQPLCCRLILCCVAATGWSLPAHGQVLTWQPGQTDFPIGSKATGTSGAEVDEGPTAIRLHAMPEPSPALKYRFWVSSALRERGSVMPHISRAQLLYYDRPNLSQLRKEYADRTEAWHEGPLANMPKEEVRQYLSAFKATLDELHKGVKLERIDYDLRLQDLRGAEVFNFLLPEMQHYRELGRLLSLEVRLAMAERRFDDAVHSLHAGFRLSEVASANGGTLLVGKLVSIAITGMMLGLVEEMIQLPEAPNMYWALASLPDSMWSVRESIEGESTSIRRFLGNLMEDRSTAKPATTWNEQLVQGILTVGSLGSSHIHTIDDVSVKLVAGSFLIACGDRSRQQLVQSGLDEAVVAAMPSAQAVIEAFRMNIDRVQALFFKNVLLPSELREKHVKLAEEQYQHLMSTEFADPATITIGLLMPAMQATFSASQRVESTRNRLVTFEALRAYAAANGNKLPAALVDLLPVPAFQNAFTRKPFEYRRISDTEAVLHKSPEYSGDKKTEYRLSLMPGN